MRIRRAGETLASLDLLARDRTSASLVAFHELHARHLREDGDHEGAARADARAEGARWSGRTPHRT